MIYRKERRRVLRYFSDKGGRGMAVLIAYGTIEGQTGKIAQFLEDVVRKMGESVDLYDTSDRTEDVDLAAYDKIILAASVHERRHPQDFEVFVTARRKELNEKETLLLSVSLNAAFEEGQEEAQDYMDEMKMRTEFEPKAELRVAGAVRASSYGYYETQVLRHVVLRGREVDPAVKEYEFTDWDALANSVKSFLSA